MGFPLMGFLMMDLKFIIRNNLMKIYGGRIAENVFYYSEKSR